MLITECSTKTRQGRHCFSAGGKKSLSAFYKAHNWCINILLLLLRVGVRRDNERKKEERRLKGGTEREMKLPENEKGLSSALSSGHENPYPQGSSQERPSPSITCDCPLTSGHHWGHPLIQPGPVPFWLEPIGEWDQHFDQTCSFSDLHINSKGSSLHLHLDSKWKKWKWLPFSCIWLFETSWTIACQSPLSMRFSRQEYWSGYHSLLQKIFPTQGSNSGLLHCRWILYLLNHQGSPYIWTRGRNIQ